MSHLVLMRRVGEAIIIGDDIDLRILEIKGSQIKIGIEAPRDVRIVRSEILNKVPNHKRSNNHEEA